jgi:hypothetical protein
MLKPMVGHRFQSAADVLRALSGEFEDLKSYGWPGNSIQRLEWVQLKNRQYLMTRVLRGHRLITKSIKIYDRTKAALVELP